MYIIYIYGYNIHLTLKTSAFFWFCFLKTSALDTRFENNFKFHLEKQSCLIEKPRYSIICPVCSREVF